MQLKKSFNQLKLSTEKRNSNKNLILLLKKRKSYSILFSLFCVILSQYLRTVISFQNKYLPYSSLPGRIKDLGTGNISFIPSSKALRSRSQSKRHGCYSKVSSAIYCDMFRTVSKVASKNSRTSCEFISRSLCERKPRSIAWQSNYRSCELLPFSRHSSMRHLSTMSDSVAKNSDVDSGHSTDRQETCSRYTPYEQAVRKLYMTNMFVPAKMGLENTEKLHDALGCPTDNSDVTIVHIAGTNGKGSVAMKIAKTLEVSGHKVGLFVSPHVSSFRERMSVNGITISEEQVARLLPRVFSVCEENDIPATFFEITTALAFLFYQEEKVQAIVLETGLGGRLDATNIVKNPALSIITSIGLEHTRILGDTKEKIALEKGGIMKKGRPVLVGPDVPHKVLRQCASEKQVSAYFTCEDILGKDESILFSVSSSSDDESAVKDYDLENARMAEAAVTILRREKDTQENNIESEHGLSFAHLNPISKEHIKLGTSFRPPCRFERVDVLVNHVGAIQRKLSDKEQELDVQNGDKIVPVILDVAHNPPAMLNLIKKLDSCNFPDKKNTLPWRFVAGFSSDKDIGLCVSYLSESCGGDAKQIHLIEAAHPRAAQLEQILSASPHLNDANFDSKDRSITTQVQLAVKLAAHRNEILVICGSVFVMAEAREVLGFEEPKDSEYIAEMSGAGFRHAQENFGELNPDILKKQDVGKK